MNAESIAAFQSIRAANQVTEGDAGDAVLQTLAANVEIDQTVPRRDALAIPFVTLDPAASTDLDQAFALHSEGELIILHYAIADIGAFVARSSALEELAWSRGVTVYAPDGSVPLYPRVLSSQRASLLADGPRPAVLLTIEIDSSGSTKLRKVERAWVRSRAKLAYENVLASELFPESNELARRIARSEQKRGAFRMDRPKQEVVNDASSPNGFSLRFAPRLSSEDQNAALSLAANLAVGEYLFERGLGLFRVMDEPADDELHKLRQLAKSLEIAWSATESLNQVIARLDGAVIRHAAFALAVRKCAGGARYMHWSAPGMRPWHAAIAATYAHATAPMRRLADRYVLDLLVAFFDHDVAAVQSLLPMLEKLPDLMASAERTAAKVDRDSIEWLESKLLTPLIGQRLSARVIEVGNDGVQLQIDEPAVLWRVRRSAAPNAQVGDLIVVTVTSIAQAKGAPANSNRLGFAKTVDLIVVSV